MPLPTTLLLTLLALTQLHAQTPHAKKIFSDLPKTVYKRHGSEWLKGSLDYETQSGNPTTYHFFHFGLNAKHDNDITQEEADDFKLSLDDPDPTTDETCSDETCRNADSNDVDDDVAAYLSKKTFAAATQQVTNTNANANANANANKKFDEERALREKNVVRNLIKNCQTKTDKREECKKWVAKGECNFNTKFMTRHCCPSCKSQLYDDERVLAAVEIEKALNSGVHQEINGSPQENEKMDEIVKKTKAHLATLKPAILENCKNENKLCTFWASIGECASNQAFMTTSCAPACRTCDKLLYENRCPYDESIEPIYKPGDLNSMFESLVPLYDDKYGPINILSSPSANGPWVVTFDNFLTPEECDRLVELGAEANFSRSTDVGAQKFDGTTEKVESKGRTSSNAWCTKDCLNDTFAVMVMDRILEVTRTELRNTEHFQILRYYPGEFYNTHHDYIPLHKNRNQGPRILTFFLYLSEVEGGGETGFPTMKPPLKVQPRKGKALLWPSVLDADPYERDGRTMHEACNVTAGMKYAANAWIHLKDFRGAHEMGCTG